MLKQVKALLRKAHVPGRFTARAVQLYSMVFPPPYRRANMEFDSDVWNGICTFHSQDGRQIGENNTGPERYREEIETEHRTCTFEGSRNGLPINVTALRQVMAAWDDSLQFTTLLRNDYIRRRKLGTPRLNLRQGYVFSKLGAAYAAYLARRKDNPITSLPRLETAFFTLGVGVFMVVRTFMEKGDLSVLDEEPLSAEALYEMADSSRTLISADGKGCAGSKRLILDYLDVTMNGTYKKELSSLEARRAIDSIGDWDRFYDYVYASSRLELLVKLNQSLCAQALFALQSDPGQLSKAELDLVGKSLASCYEKPRDGLDDRTVMSNFMRIVLTLLDELDYPAVRVALAGAGLINPDGGAGSRLQDLSSSDLRKAAAMRMRLSSDLIYPYCRKELDGLHRALGRFEDDNISIDGLNDRCCGTGLKPLLKILENG